MKRLFYFFTVLFTTLVLFYLLILSGEANAGAIATAAAGLSARQWTMLTNTQIPGLDLTAQQYQQGAGGIFYDGIQPMWDSTALRLYMEMGEHATGNFNDCAHTSPPLPHTCWKNTWQYNESNSTFTIMGVYPQYSNGFHVNAPHSYTHVAWDDVNKVGYVRKYYSGEATNEFFRFCANSTPSYCATQGAGQWAQIASFSPNSEEGSGQTLVFQSNLNGGTLLYFSGSGNSASCGRLMGFRETGGTGTWSTIDDGAGCKFSGQNAYGLGVYSAVKGVAVFGGGNNGFTGSTHFWRIGASGGPAVAIDNSPCPVSTSNGSYGGMAPDPVSGNIILIGCTVAGQLWELNPTGTSGSQWTLIDGNLAGVGEICNISHVTENCSAYHVPIPISTYGVIAYWKYRNTTPETAELWIYKHTASGGDVIPPTVSLTAPAAGTVSGNVTVSATASDTVGVVGVQFKVDGVNQGAEDTVAPYSITWNSSTATNGSHTLTATARDAAGNTTTSAGVNVTVTGGISSGTSVLSTLADSMSADSWAALTTPASCNTTTTLLEVGGSIFKDASQGAYDPVLQQIHFIGKGTTGVVRHVVYDLATNACTLRTTPPWSQTDDHSYEYGPTIDARGRILYRGHAGTLAIERYNLDTQTWQSSVTPSGAVAANVNGFQANAFHYERGTAGQLILAGLESGGNGVLYEYDPTANTFARLNGGALLSGFVDFSAAEYSEVHKVTFFGGRGGTYRQMNTRGTISTVSTTGMLCQPGINRDGILQADPVTGNFVLLCGGGTSSWQIYNPTTNVWTAKTAPGSVANHILQVIAPTGFGQTYGKVGVPISNHGVILYVGCNNGVDCQMRLYKGGAFTTADRDFKTNCYKANVVHCNGFDSVNDTTGTYDVFTGYTKFQGIATGQSGAYGDPSLDCTIKLGNCSLQLVTGANSGANAGGSFTTSFRDDSSKTFGANDEFYIQWRERWSPCLLYTGANDAACTANGLANNWTNRRIYANNLGSNGGWKLLTLNEATRADHTTVLSHGDIALATQDTDQRGFLEWYEYGFTGIEDNSETTFGGQLYLQWNNGNVDGVSCIYPGPFVEPGCKRWRPDQWVTIQLHIKPNGGWNTEGLGTFEMWYALEGQPAIKVLEKTPAVGQGTNFGNTDTVNSRFGQYLLENYHTGKDPAETNPIAYTWFDNVIVSTSRIADPGVTAPVIPDTTPPTVTITSPIPPTTSTTTSPITVSGTATDNIGVTSVTWTCAACVTKGGTATSSPGTSISWLIPALDLVAGTNTLNVVSHDAAGNASTAATLTITYTAPPIFWVRPTGTMSGCTGSSTPPTTDAGYKATIAAGIGCLASGNTLNIRAGVYVETINLSGIPSGGGSYATATIVQGYLSERPIIQPSGGRGIYGDASSLRNYVIFKGFDVDGQNAGSLNHNIVISGTQSGPSNHHIRLDGINTYDNGKNSPSGTPEGGALMEWCNDCEFINGSSHDNGRYANAYLFDGTQAPYGFYWHGQRGLIHNNQIYNNGAFGIHAYTGFGGDTIDDMEISGNTIYNNGIRYFDGSGNPNRSSAGILASIGQHYRIFNNVVYGGTTQEGISVTHACNVAPICTVYSNTIYGMAGVTGVAGLYLWDVSSIEARNNIVMQNGGNGNIYLEPGTVTATLSNNLCSSDCGVGSSNVVDTVANMFVNAGAGNFRLGPTALARDAGVSNLGAAYNTDLDGLPRSAPWDIGAYEFVGGISPVVTIVNPTSNPTLGVTSPLFSLGGTSNLP
jgi:hypothetical protein